MSGVGISFGADRIYDVLTGLDKFPASLASSTQILFANMDEEGLHYVLPVAAALRKEGIAVEIYPDSAKLRKQFEYAERRQIPFLSINGSEEIAAGEVNIKNLSTGDQRRFPVEDIEGIFSWLTPRV